MRMRSGFALITVLWMISVSGGAAAASLLAMRDAIDAARNRVVWERGFWRATRCAQRARAAADAALDSAGVLRYDDAWRGLGGTIAHAPAMIGCDVVVEAAGDRIDVNHAPMETIDRVIASIGKPEWTSGIRARVASRDSEPIIDLAELAEAADDRWRDSVLIVLSARFTTERGRVSLATASADVLALVPGFTDETASVLVSHRETVGAVRDLGELLPLLSRDAAAQLTARYQDALRATAPEPDAWIVRAISIDGAPAVPVELRTRFVRSGRGVAVAESDVVR